jgi:hypothetical protein
MQDPFQCSHPILSPLRLCQVQRERLSGCEGFLGFRTTLVSYGMSQATDTDSFRRNPLRDGGNDQRLITHVQGVVSRTPNVCGRPSPSPDHLRHLKEPLRDGSEKPGLVPVSIARIWHVPPEFSPQVSEDLWRMVLASSRIQDPCASSPVNGLEMKPPDYRPDLSVFL